MTDKNISLRVESEEIPDLTHQNPDDLSHSECIRLCHKLSARLAELELQDDGAYHSPSRQDQYLDLYDLAPVGFLSLDEEGLILHANLSVEFMLGASRGSLVGKPFSSFISPAKLDNYNTYRRQLDDSPEIRALELRMVKYGGVTFQGRLEGSCSLTISSGPVYRFILNNITKRKLVEEALLESAEKYRLLYERMSLAVKSASFGVWDWDLAADAVEWDDMMYEIYGISKDAPMPLETWINTVYPGDLASALELLQDKLEHNGREVEFKIVRPDGQVRHIFSAEGFIRNHNNEVIRIVGVHTDITKRKQAEEGLRSYARRLVEMEEELRKKIATELHDEIGRDLTVLGMNCSIICSSLKSVESEKIGSRIEDSAKLIEKISRTTRGIMAGLRPPVLDDYGLVSALRWHAELFSTRTGIAVSVLAEENMPKLKPGVELALFRISQEALMNTAKHADAKLATISLVNQNGTIVFTIADKGRGFCPSSPSHPHDSGWGMTIMRERAELAGAEFAVYAEPGQGTTVTIRVMAEDN